MDDDDDETYLLLLLSDSNLPTGAFVASSGLESYIKHGFGADSPNGKAIAFLQDSIGSYARSALPFVSDAHRVISDFCSRLIAREGDDASGSDRAKEETITKLRCIDELYECMTLNHVTRRASKSQGVALLTLYSKGFSRPSSLPFLPSPNADSNLVPHINTLIDHFKLLVRRGDVHGHLPTCWGILTGALGLTLGMFSYIL